MAVTLARSGNRVVIARVVPGSRAARAGLRAGDQVLTIDGEPVLSAGQGRGMLAGPAGVEALIEVRRGARTRTVSVLRERYLDSP